MELIVMFLVIPFVITNVEIGISLCIRLDVERAGRGKDLGMETVWREIEPRGGEWIIDALGEIGFNFGELCGQLRLHDWGLDKAESAERAIWAGERDHSF